MQHTSLLVRIYATETQPEAGNIGLETLKEAKAKLNVPICAIGGLTVENSGEVIDAGAKPLRSD